MAKHLSVPLPDPAPRVGARLRNVAAVALGLLLAPLIYESATLCAARWRAMSGVYAAPETPVIDAIGAWSGATASWARRKSVVWFRDPGWKAGPTIGLSIAWALGAAWLLRGWRR